MTATAAHAASFSQRRSTWARASPPFVSPAAMLSPADSTPSTPALCRPMPSGPTGGFGGMMAEDATDIGVYLTTIPPLPGGGDIPHCPVGDDE